MSDELDAQLDAELAANPAAGVSVANLATPETPASATPPVVATPETPVAPATPTPTPATPPATPVAGTNPATPVAPAAPTYDGARDFAAKALGYANASQYGDDAAFLQALVAGQQTAQARLAEMQQLAQYGQMYLAQRQPATGAPTPSAAPDPLAAYKSPEFNPAWQNLIERTESGGFKLRDGADPAILPKFLAYQQYRQDTAEKFLSDPVNFLKPLIAQQAQEQAQQLLEQRFGQQAEKQYVDGFIEKNSNWLFQQSANGQPVHNSMTGQPILSPVGQRFHAHLADAARSGITNNAAQEKYAMALLRADLMAPAVQQQAAVQDGEAAKRKLLETMNRVPQPSGSLVGPGNTGHTAPAVQNPEMSLADRLKADLIAAGFNDASIGA